MRPENALSYILQMMEHSYGSKWFIILINDYCDIVLLNNDDIIYIDVNSDYYLP
jgi:hypothetical protein